MFLLLLLITIITNCNGMYDINTNRNLKEYNINLDLPPEDRWKDIAIEYSSDIVNVINTAETQLPWLFSKTIKYLAKNYFVNIPEHLGDYGKEIIGISKYSNISLYDVVLYNIFYEVFSLCTSMVINSEDTIIHARNMDFGVLMEGIVPLLKNITIHVNFIKNNKVIYRSHSFAGLVGIFTGMKPYKFSITINQRFAINGGFMGIFEWFRNKKPHWNSLIVRDLLEGDYDFNSVIKMLSNVDLVAPVYYIIGGTNNNEGALITRERKQSIEPIYLNTSKYVFQTNHDHWNEPFYFDDRTTHGKKYLDEYEHNIYNVEKLLLTKPTLNRITIYGSIMIPKYDFMHGFIQNCIEPCHAISLL